MMGLEYLSDSFRFFVFLMVSLSFFVGIMLIVSYEAFEIFHRSLQREYGIKRRIVPKVEDNSNYFVDLMVSKYPFFAGIIIAILAFLLLLLYSV